MRSACIEKVDEEMQSANLDDVSDKLLEISISEIKIREAISLYTKFMCLRYEY